MSPAGPSHCSSTAAARPQRIGHVTAEKPEMPDARLTGIGRPYPFKHLGALRYQLSSERVLFQDIISSSVIDSACTG
jgi:hypothetical protein